MKNGTRVIITAEPLRDGEKWEARFPFGYTSDMESAIGQEGVVVGSWEYVDITGYKVLCITTGLTHWWSSDQFSEISEWNPIETAPKDGTIVLVVRQGFTPATAFYSTKFNRWLESAYEDLDTCIEALGEDWVLGGDWPVTHWMPLPTLL